MNNVNFIIQNPKSIVKLVIYKRNIPMSSIGRIYTRDGIPKILYSNSMLISWRAILQKLGNNAKASKFNHELQKDDLTIKTILK